MGMGASGMDGTRMRREGEGGTRMRRRVEGERDGKVMAANLSATRCCAFPFLFAHKSEGSGRVKVAQGRECEGRVNAERGRERRRDEMTG